MRACSVAQDRAPALVDLLFSWEMGSMNKVQGVSPAESQRGSFFREATRELL